MSRVLDRRELLTLLGGAGAAFLAACTRTRTDTAVATTAPAATTSGSSNAVPGCVVKPELTEGPYFVDEKLNRSDLRSDPSDGSVKQGATLKLTFRVSKVSNGSCDPLQGAKVDVWHCDAAGVYSDVRDPGGDTTGRKFLRGYQTTNADGVATFTTIVPGWYRGRAVHVHFKIRKDDQEFTSQLFFTDAFLDEVYANPPYESKGSPDTSNSADGIYGQSGNQLTLDTRTDGDGYAATFDIGLNL